MSEVPRNTPAIDDEEILSGIRGWVEIETPSPDGNAVNRLADVVQSEAAVLVVPKVWDGTPICSKCGGEVEPIVAE